MNEEKKGLEAGLASFTKSLQGVKASKALGDLWGKIPTGGAPKPKEAEVEEDEVSTLRNMVSLQSQQLKKLLEEKEIACREKNEVIKRLAEREAHIKAIEERSGEEVSVSVADSFPAPEETISSTSGSAEELNVLKVEVEDLKSKLKAARDRVAFQNVDTMEQEIRRIRTENSTLQKSLVVAQVSLDESVKSLELEKKRVTFLETQGKELEKTISLLKHDLAQSKTETVEISKHLAAERAKEHQTRRALEEAQTRYETLSTSFDADFKHRMKEVHARHEDELRKSQQTLDDITAERNSLKQTVRSLQKELKQVLRSGTASMKVATGAEAESIEKQNIRLQEELERTKKSLNDAITALHDQIIETESRTGALMQELAAKSSDKTTLMLINENKQLRSIANHLSEEIQDKAQTIEDLRRQLRALGAKTMELEETLSYRKATDMDAEESKLVQS
jgi:DNA repair exonuclease SbcCD ATPase subunit